MAQSKNVRISQIVGIILIGIVCLGVVSGKPEKKPLEEEDSQTLFDVTQLYIQRLGETSQANQELNHYRSELSARMTDSSKLTSRQSVEDWPKDELTEWVSNYLGQQLQLLYQHGQIVWTVDHDEFKANYHHLLDYLTLTFIETEEKWESYMLSSPSMEEIIEVVEEIELLKPQWKNTLLGVRWAFFEREFNRFAFYLIQENISQTGEIAPLNCQLLEQLTKQHPQSLLSQTWTKYSTLLNEGWAHDAIIEELIQVELK